MHRHRDFHHYRPSRERPVPLRLLCSDLVEVTWQDARPGFFQETRPAFFQKEIAVMEELGQADASLLMGVPVGKGLKVTIAIASGRTFHGIVRDCRHEPGGYLVDVRFPTPDDSASDQYRPRHFLDTSRLDWSAPEQA
jgi:hypothetical protein